VTANNEIDAIIAMKTVVMSVRHDVKSAIDFQVFERIPASQNLFKPGFKACHSRPRLPHSRVGCGGNNGLILAFLRSKQQHITSLVVISLLFLSCK
jgi:hypothetical protein